MSGAAMAVGTTSVGGSNFRFTTACHGQSRSFGCRISTGLDAIHGHMASLNFNASSCVSNTCVAGMNRRVNGFCK